MPGMILREYADGSKVNKRQQGSYYEDKAATYLTGLGYRILERNYRCRYAEIDIVAMEGRCLVFAEVKARSSLRKGSGLESIGAEKRKRISAAARWFLLKHREFFGAPVRFDVISIDNDRIRLVRDAFIYVE